MPQQGFHCIVDYVDVPYAACIDCAATKGRCQFTASLLRGMAEQAAGRTPDEPGSASVTSLTGCARQAYLKEVEDYFRRPDEQYWAYRGTIGHTMVERGAGADVVAERRFARPLRLPSGRSLTITGRPDEVVPERRLLIEYKTTDRAPKTPSLQHVAQLNAYRWLVAPEHPIERLGIVYLTMRGVQKATVPIWPDEQVERFLGERAAELVLARETGAWPSMTEDAWMCGYCPVAAACRRSPVTTPAPAPVAADPSSGRAGVEVAIEDAVTLSTATTAARTVPALDGMPALDTGAEDAEPGPVRLTLPVLSSPQPAGPNEAEEPLIEPDDLDEWDPAERAEAVGAA